MSAADLTKKQRKDRIDKLAAQILLQTFIEKRRSAARLSSAAIEESNSVAEDNLPDASE